MMRRRSSRVMRRQAVEGLAGRGHRRIDRREQPEAALPTVGTGDRTAVPLPKPGQHLLNHVANQGFVDLHGGIHLLAFFS